MKSYFHIFIFSDIANTKSIRVSAIHVKTVQNAGQLQMVLCVDAASVSD